MGIENDVVVARLGDGKFGVVAHLHLIVVFIGLRLVSGVGVLSHIPPNIGFCFGGSLRFPSTIIPPAVVVPVVRVELEVAFFEMIIEDLDNVLVLRIVIEKVGNVARIVGHNAHIKILPPSVGGFPFAGFLVPDARAPCSRRQSTKY